MDRIFIDEIIDGTAIIAGENYNHLINVLRFEIGDKIETAYDGLVYIGQIVEIKNKLVKLDIIEQLELDNEPKTKISLFQAIAKGSRMDYVFQKGTEIGITDFNVFTSHRAIVKLNDKNKKSRRKRWEKIIEGAGKQSFRNIIPDFNGFYDFEELLEELKKFPVIIVPYESEENNNLKDLIKSERWEKIALVIGPEGGFEKSEIAELKNIGANIVTLGPRILRTETAGPLASGLILYEYGDMD